MKKIDLCGKWDVFNEKTGNFEGLVPGCVTTDLINAGKVYGEKTPAKYGKEDGIILNPGGYTHTSVALLDALKAVSIPTVEVHLTDPDRREPFRKISFVREACVKTIRGHGGDGDLEALEYLASSLEEKHGR